MHYKLTHTHRDEPHFVPVNTGTKALERPSETHLRKYTVNNEGIFNQQRLKPGDTFGNSTDWVYFGNTSRVYTRALKC